MGRIKIVPKGFLTVTQTAKALKISRNYVYKMINSGRLGLYRPGTPYFISKKEVTKLKG